MGETDVVKYVQGGEGGVRGVSAWGEIRWMMAGREKTDDMVVRVERGSW